MQGRGSRIVPPRLVGRRGALERDQDGIDGAFGRALCRRGAGGQGRHRRSSFARHVILVASLRAPTHPEIWAAVESGAVPAHLDRRAEGDAIAMRVLEYRARLGAVKLLP